MKDRLLLAFYGDDFTGSTDAMEALTSNGFRTVLFLEVPDARMLDQFEGIQCIGIAGTARAKTKTEIHTEIAPIFEQLQKINPYFIHYKICSTFDSSHEIGSIGYAIDIAKKYFKNQLFPVIAAVPQLGRYTVFGQHFARKGDTIYRLDRHPVMAHHPITPMNEADLADHLRKQTTTLINLINIHDIEKGEDRISNLFHEFSKKPDIQLVLFDALRDQDLYKIANVLWKSRNDHAQFLVGSSGIEYAFSQEWKDLRLDENPKHKKSARLNDEILVISGSASEITSEQMNHAIKKSGFHAEKIPYQLFFKTTIPHEFLEKVARLIQEKKKIIIYTTDGPDDEALHKTREYFVKQGLTNREIGNKLGRMLGKWTRYLLESYPIKRLIIAGGDTSGFITKELDIYALEMITSISAGAPLCEAYSKNACINGLEIALKGGQLGDIDFYERVRSW